MMKKNFFITILLLLALLAIWYLRNNNYNASFANEHLFRDIHHLVVTKHAHCRMDCRHISTGEIKEIIQGGNVNYAKSGRGSKGDATYALEGYTHEHQHIRVIVAPEHDGLVVVTCIDLDKEWPCNCY
ncbi:MAG: DUF4258 domain-containing protein [Ginsengibacter sp.]